MASKVVPEQGPRTRDRGISRIATEGVMRVKTRRLNSSRRLKAQPMRSSRSWIEIRLPW